MINTNINERELSSCHFI